MTENVAAPPTYKNKKKRTRRRRLIIVLVIVLIVVAAGGYFAYRARQAYNEMFALTYSGTTVLEKGDIQNTVSATGTVESAESMVVYSTLANTVEKVHVEVGDYVEKGQLLAELDGDAINDQLEAQSTTVAVSAKNSAAQIKTAEDNYAAAKQALDNGLNAGVISAESQVDTAYTAYTGAVKTYERYRDSIAEGENSTLLAQDAALNSAASAVDSAGNAYADAREARDTARSAYNAKKAAVDAAQTSVNAKEQEIAGVQAELDASLDPAEQSALQDELDALQGELAALQTTLSGLKTELAALQSALSSANAVFDSADVALDNASEGYDLAIKQKKAAQTSVDNALADYQTAVENAYTAYQTAQATLEAAQATAQTQLQSYLNSLNSAQAAADDSASRVSLKQLRADLASTRITAPAAGTITAVYATVGASGSGLLFVIENVDDLIVETSVKGYDIGAVKEGLAVTIKSDATGEAIFDGEITDIAPTANKDSQGNTASGDVLFATEVKVLTPDTGLKIGMSVRLNYILEEQQDVFTVPYDAVYENAAGAICVLAAAPQESGKFLLSELAVETGMSNDLYTVISGEGVAEGVRVINDPGNYRLLIGTAIAINENQSAAAQMAGMMQGSSF